MGLRAILLTCVSLVLWPVVSAAQPVTGQSGPDGIDRLVAAIGDAVEAGDGNALRALARRDIAPAALSEFVLSLTSPKPSQSAVKERDRTLLVSGHVRLLLETFTDREAEGRVTTWRLDAESTGPDAAPWRIAEVERLSVVGGLFRLGLNAATEYDVHNLVIRAPDLTLQLPAGYAFVARTPDGPTALVLIGRGRMDFAPTLEAERGQVRIFCGDEAVKTAFEAVFIRLPPEEFATRVAAGALTPRAADPRHLRRAAQTFETYLPKSFQLDLNDLSRATWSLTPGAGDFVAEIVTGRYGALTYARATTEPEDISFFDRRRHRNIAVYPSADRLAARGRFFSEDDQIDYDVTHYDIEAAFAPDRLWIDGAAKLTIHTKASSFSTLALRLADSLVIRSISSPQFGRLLHLRIVGQNNVLVGFPATVVSGTDIELDITYGGRLPPQGIDREAINMAQESRQEEVLAIPIEAQYLYSNRSYWYPQSQVTDYATATLAITVPGEFDVVASGTPEGPAAVMPAAPGFRARRKFVFNTTEPARYLACLISRFQSIPATSVKVGDGADPMSLFVAANTRTAPRSHGLGEKAAEILKFYGGLMADTPYDSLTLALTESDLPGGHSPAYFAIVNQPVAQTPFVWTNDPVSFQNYPSFFIAHEIAHQWWGQAVGGKNYHEQWLSEGFAQYFAALFAQRERGPQQFTAVLRQMRRWAIDDSSQGPVYLGYRLGHIKSDSRVFRAIVYNKGAMVLHMLRRMMGDEAFFNGLRDFYATWRYKKAGTDDFRLAMEKAGGQPLARFFERWIYGSAIPTVRFSSQVEGTQIRVRFEQNGEIFDIPITVTLDYADGTSDNVVVKVTEKTTERLIPLKGALRGVEVNKDAGSLAEIAK